LAVAITLLLAGAAQAFVVSSAGLTIGCTPSGGTPSVSALSIPWSTIEASIQSTGTAAWSLPSPMILYDASANPLASLNSLTVRWDHDPLVDLTFSVQNLSSTTATFTFTSSVQTVNLTNPQAYATAGITLTDGNHNGGTLTGDFSGKAYLAYYNNSADFAYLVGTFNTAADSTNVANDRSPSSGRTTISGTVTQIASAFEFDLTPQDEASGTSNFYMTPEPATLTLLAIGGLVALRRRRR
jgi:hypothetical protein